MMTRNFPLARALVPGALAVLALLWLAGGLALSGASPSSASKEPLQRLPSDAASVRYVATSGTDSGDCTASAAPCRSVQYAVDQASAGSVIKVASGLYTGVQGRPAPPGYPAPLAGDVVTQVVYLSRTLTLRGGYTTTNGFAEPPQPARHPTTLDAQGRGRVLFVGGEVSPTLEGLRITQGSAGGLGGYIAEGSIFDGGGGVYVITATLAVNASQVYGNAAAAGGGLYAYHGEVWLDGSRVTDNIASGGGGLYLQDSSATLRANTVADNVAYWAGGGLYLENSAATLDGNHVTSNVGDFSGGLHLDGSSATLSGNSVISNTGNAGGGLYLENSAVTLDGDVVRANAAQRGGGLFLGFSAATLTNDVVADNQAGEGSGLYLLASSARLRQTTLARNGDGSGLHVAQSFYGDPSRAWLTNTIVASHTLGITATAGCTVSLEGTLWGAGAKWGGAGTVLAGTLQVDGDPAFVDPEAGDYHVGLASAAVDRGLDAGVEVDLDGDPRPLGQGYDIGADEVGLILVKRARPDPVQAGAPLTYTLRLTNASDVDLHATLTDTLPLPLAPGQTALVPGGQITWTAHVTAPRGTWLHTFAVTVAEDYAGPLTNVVRASTQEGASAVYTATATAFVPRRLYLPLVSRDAQGMTAVVGEYVLLRNPCTTEPCLPGMVYAVSVGGTPYYLTVEGAWLWSNRSWEGYTPQVGDWVALSGHVDEALDTWGLSFYNMEVLSLEPALSPPTVTGNVVITGFSQWRFPHAKPC